MIVPIVVETRKPLCLKQNIKGVVEELEEKLEQEEYKNKGIR